MTQLDLLLTSRIDGHNRIDHLDDDRVRAALPKLAWFNSTKADRYSKKLEIEHVQDIIGFARTIMNRCAFVARNGSEVQMIGYRNDLRVPGPTLQLDATSLIDGVKQLGPQRQELAHRREHGRSAGSDGNLRCIIRKPPLQKGQQVANVARRDDTANHYRNWIAETVKNPEYFKPGQQAPIVTRKAFIEASICRSATRE
jgi:hypothetical protein